MIKKPFVVAAIILAVALVLTFLIELPPLVFGWIYFIARNLRQVSVHPASVITGVVFVALLMAAIHGCSSSYCRAISTKSAIKRRWPIRRTLAILGIVVVMFVVCLSTIGLVRHVGWMFSSTDPTYKESVQYKAVDWP